MIPYSIPETIDRLEEMLYAIIDDTVEADRNARMTVQSGLYHLRQIKNTYNHSGTCQYIITMDKQQYRLFCEQQQLTNTK